MHQKMYLKLSGVSGGSEDPRHFGEIELLGFTWGGKHLQNTSAGTDRQFFRNMTLTKNRDRSSHALFVASGTGRNFNLAQITVEDLGEKKNLVRTIRIEMGSIMVSTFSTAGGVDSFTLNFDAVRMLS